MVVGFEFHIFLNFSLIQSCMPQCQNLRVHCLYYYYYRCSRQIFFCDFFAQQYRFFYFFWCIPVIVRVHRSFDRTLVTFFDTDTDVDDDDVSAAP